MVRLPDSTKPNRTLGNFEVGGRVCQRVDARIFRSPPWCRRGLRSFLHPGKPGFGSRRIAREPNRSSDVHRPGFSHRPGAAATERRRRALSATPAGGELEGEVLGHGDPSGLDAPDVIEAIAFCHQFVQLSSANDDTLGTGTMWRRRKRPASPSTPPFSWAPSLPGRQ
jgi:hypothetical protein